MEEIEDLDTACAELVGWDLFIVGGLVVGGHYVVHLQCSTSLEFK
jgi:hypothetical protein